ncbi:hypothetical protein ATANTOWER_020803 [Ataeniobius toweri]|uniref:Uncharacterized protein n=1 Tax=Ataeniobius toweri TaxID=208326 RepID=A0ABU7CC43_9TELE|nr:hypothetical protein [Ataeniobius toweri]
MIWTVFMWVKNDVGGQDGKQKIEFCLLIEDEAFPPFPFSFAGWSEGVPHPTVSFWLPFSPIDLTQSPATPREPMAQRHTASFVEEIHRFRLTADSADKNMSPVFPYCPQQTCCSRCVTFRKLDEL